MKKVISFSVLLLFVLSLSGFFACSKDEDDSGGIAKLMFIHGYTAGKNSTVLVSDSAIAALTAGFGNFTLYETLNSGNSTIKVKDNTLDSILASGSFNLKKNANYSLIYANKDAGSELLLVNDDLTVADSTQSYLRLINLVPNGNNMSLNVTSGATLASGIAFKTISAFSPVAPGKTDFTIVAGSTVVSTISNFSLLPGKKYSILMTGLVGQNPKASHNIIVNK
ncbi:MAG: DUF4397 domain-containing protein [Saprospiraceae bacterium]|nr:DUF4397 domain-containing protein [Saprospiraceae bacterium]